MAQLPSGINLRKALDVAGKSGHYKGAVLRQFDPISGPEFQWAIANPTNLLQKKSRGIEHAYFLCVVIQDKHLAIGCHRDVTNGTKCLVAAHIVAESQNRLRSENSGFRGSPARRDG